MVGIGTLVNTATVIVGSLIGIILKRGIGDRFKDSIIKTVGVATIFIGISGTLAEMLEISDGALASQGILIMTVSLAAGTFIGELLKIEDRLEGIGNSIRKFKIFSTGSDFTEGFVTSTLVICVGAMSIVGPLRDVLYSDPSILFTKSLLDFISTMIFASTLGAGVLCSAIPLFLFQGAVALSAHFIEPYLYSFGDGRLVSNISMVGSVLIFAIGINLIFGKKLKVGNMLPALIVPVIYAAAQSLVMIHV